MGHYRPIILVRLVTTTEMIRERVGSVYCKGLGGGQLHWFTVRVPNITVIQQWSDWAKDFETRTWYSLGSFSAIVTGTVKTRNGLWLRDNPHVYGEVRHRGAASFYMYLVKDSNFNTECVEIFRQSTA